jgi:hypothetical protein
MALMLMSSIAVSLISKQSKKIQEEWKVNLKEPNDQSFYYFIQKKLNI